MSDATHLPAPVPDLRVCAVLVCTGDAALPRTLDALAAQDRRPDQLLVLGAEDTARELVRDHAGLRRAVPAIEWVRIRPGRTPQQAVAEVLGPDAGTEPGSLPDAAYLWFLTDQSEPAPACLAKLVAAVDADGATGEGTDRTGRVVGAAPKRLRTRRPRRIQTLGLQATRTGRLLPDPPIGQVDQGQHDTRHTTLAAPLDGLLLEREAYAALHGQDLSHGGFGADLDLGWRLHQSGRRLALVPGAMVLAHLDEAALESTDLPLAHRRQARRVALTRAPWWQLPALVVWVALSSLLSALVLLLLKRPRAAFSELQGVGAAVGALGAQGSRRRYGVRRTAAGRRTTAALLIPGARVLEHLGDRIHEAVAPSERRRRRDEAAGLETGPAEADVHGLEEMPESWGGRVLRHPGALALLLVTAATVVGGRTVPGGILQRLTTGIAGGELLGTGATSAALWHAFRDGWQGPGVGGPATFQPWLPLLAAVTWIGEHLPFARQPQSPAGAAVAVLMVLALPLAAASAYLAARAITRQRLPRAVGAVAWSTAAAATTTVADGRLGAAIAVVLLPLAASGVASVWRRSGTWTGAFAAALALGLLGAVALPLMLVGCLLALPAALAPGRHLRALVAALLPAALLGPYAATVADDPRLLLSGPGLIGRAVTAQPWQMALGHPGGPGSYPVLLSLPLVALAVVGLLRTGRGLARWVVALAGLLLLAAALAAPRLTLATVLGPDGRAQHLHLWSGVPLLGYVLALCALAVWGCADLRLLRAHVGRTAVLRWPVVALAVVAVGAGVAGLGVYGLGHVLHSATDPRSRLAVDQANGGLANRVLLLERAGESVDYRVLGREPASVARTLPPTPAQADAAETRSQGLARAVAGLTQTTSAQATPATALAQWAVGFVALRAPADDPLARQLDATAGLVRQGTVDGVTTWRVAPLVGGAGNTGIAPSRLRIVEGERSRLVESTGDHAATRTTVQTSGPALLVPAEPMGWAQRATVSVDGREVVPAPGTSSGEGEQPRYALPAGTHDLDIEVGPSRPWWQLGQALLVALTVFMAVPFGRRSRRQP